MAVVCCEYFVCQTCRPLSCSVCRRNIFWVILQPSAVICNILLFHSTFFSFVLLFKHCICFGYDLISLPHFPVLQIQVRRLPVLCFIQVHAGEDDLGQGNFPDSNTTGHAGARLGCCVITNPNPNLAASAISTALIVMASCLLSAIL